MKKLIFPFFYVASLLSNEPIQQQDAEASFPPEIFASNDLTFTSEHFSSSPDFTTGPLKTPITSSELTPPAPVLQSSYKSPAIAASLSIIPGLGHVYLGDMKTAGALFGSAGLAAGAFLATQNNESLLLTSFVCFETSLFYGVYSAYRDARMLHGISSYSYQMPVDLLADLAYAPFRLSVLKKPEVWGGILGAMAIAVTTVYFAYPEKENVRLAASMTSVKPLLSLPIAIGEETFFRGFVQSALSESCTPWGGLVLSSLAFGAAHIPNAQDLDADQRWRYYSFSLPLITGLGAYFGWLTQKNHSLKEAVAMHMWYDFIIFSTEFIASKVSKASMRPAHFAVAIPF